MADWSASLLTSIHSHCDQGPRENLEDSFVALRLDEAMGQGWRAVILLVLDGVGGNAHGEVASGEAKRFLAGCVVSSLSSLIDQPDSTTSELILTALCEALVQASRRLAELVEQHPHLAGMATTAVCGVILNDILYLAWVGDSRCYVWSGGTLKQLTHDHSQAQELVDAGIIEPDEAKDHLLAHTITRYLGQPHALEPDTRLFRLSPGDVVLLCTDGLTDVLSDDQIAKAIDEFKCGLVGDPAHSLVDSALREGTTDNVTVLACDYQSEVFAPERTRTGAYPVRLAETIQSLQEEYDHA